MYKSLLMNLSSMKQISKFNELQIKYRQIKNEKLELEIKNKKFQECLTGYVKENESKTTEINKLKTDIKNLNKKLKESVIFHLKIRE